MSMMKLMRGWWALVGQCHAINAYCGVMGSGKSYEVVSGPLLDAVAKGRRVVTNIDGVDEEKIHRYLHEKRGIDAELLGAIVHVTTDRVREVDFFPVEQESSRGAVVTGGFVQSGDFVVIDEAWKLWAADCKIPKEHVAFFRMHRHFVHVETGVACDVAMMVQSIADLHRMLKPVIELSFVMVKLKALGAPSKYRVEMYEGWKQNKKTRTGTFVKSYKKEIFPLYRSYAGGAGTEAVIDKRQNIFINKTLWAIAVVIAMCVVIGFWCAWKFFHPSPKVSAGTTAALSSVAGGTVGLPSVPAPGAVVVSKVPDASDVWRVAGRFESDGLRYVVLVDELGRMRVDSPAAYNGLGAATIGKVDGERVAMWSGAKTSSSSRTGEIHK